MKTASPPHSVSLFDARPFFEKALVYGVQHGILDQARLETIRKDAPKGMVQIARYFGTEFLRPELERSRDRMVNLVSLYLEHSSDGDLQQAAESLRDHSSLSHSKGGSEMLKTLIAMPQNSHFGMHESGGFTDEHVPLLAKWSLRTLPEYQSELALRKQVASLLDAAVWFAKMLGRDESDLQDAGKDAEAVIRTGLLVLANRRREMPNWAEFEKMVLAMRKKPAGIAVGLPKGLTSALATVVEPVRQAVIADLQKILDTSISPLKLFEQTPAFVGRYFWLDDPTGDVDHFDRSASAAWDKVTQGHGDDSSLLTLFLCVAAGSAPKTLLTEKSAGTLVRKIRKSGLRAELTNQYIQSHAPHHRQGDYLNLWESFLGESRSTLESDFDYALKDAVALLRRECNVVP